MSGNGNGNGNGNGRNVRRDLGVIGAAVGVCIFAGYVASPQLREIARGVVGEEWAQTRPASEQSVAMLHSQMDRMLHQLATKEGLESVQRRLGQIDELIRRMERIEVRLTELERRVNSK